MAWQFPLLAVMWVEGGGVTGGLRPTVLGVPEYERRKPPEPLPVEVEQEGFWYAGTLQEWARWDSVGWRGLCTWAVAPGEQYKKWVPEARVRPRT